MVAPGNLCNNLLHKFLLLVGGREPPHVLEVARGEPGSLWKRVPKVRGEAVDDLGTPAVLLLPSQDLLPDLPVEEDDLSVDGGSGGDPSPRNPALEIRKELSVARKIVPGCRLVGGSNLPLGA